MAEPSRMLHLGLGSFHRAHQASVMHHLMQSGDARWTLAAGNTRPDDPELIASLVAQRGEYTLETVAPGGIRSYTRIASIGRIIPFADDLSGLVSLGADPATRIISFTVTEAGYHLDAHDRLDVAHAELASDLERARSGRPGRSLYAALVAILRERMRRDAGPLTLLCCDNLRHNGDRSRGGLLQFVERTGDAELRAWIETHTSSPNSMVDRITPRPPAGIRERVRDATGRDDAAPVMSESFLQWVIEDRFCAGRPAWERVGVEMVDSVAAHEEAKIRLLNASHSCIAWAGTLLGYRYIHEGVRDPRIVRIARDYATDDAIPCLWTAARPSPINLPAYRDTVLERFGNAAIEDTNERVAADSCAKLAGFILPTIRERLRDDAPIRSVAMLPALYLAFLGQWHRGALPYAYEDRALDAAAARGICHASDPVVAFCRNATLWGDLAGDERLAAAIGRAYEHVSARVRERS